MGAGVSCGPPRRRRSSGSGARVTLHGQWRNARSTPTSTETSGGRGHARRRTDAESERGYSCQLTVRVCVFGFPHATSVADSARVKRKYERGFCFGFFQRPRRRRERNDGNDLATNAFGFLSRTEKKNYKQKTQIFVFIFRTIPKTTNTFTGRLYLREHFNAFRFLYVRNLMTFEILTPKSWTRSIMYFLTIR